MQNNLSEKKQAIEKELLNLNLEQLLEIEEIIMKMIKHKIKNQKKMSGKKIFCKFHNGRI